MAYLTTQRTVLRNDEEVSKKRFDELSESLDTLLESEGFRRDPSYTTLVEDRGFSDYQEDTRVLTNTYKKQSTTIVLDNVMHTTGNDNDFSSVMITASRASAEPDTSEISIIRKAEELYQEFGFTFRSFS